MKRRTCWQHAALGVCMAVTLLASAAVMGQAAEVQGTVKRVTPQKSRLSVIDTAGKVWAFDVAPKAKVRVSGEEAKLDELAEGWKVVVHYETGDDLPIATTVEATPVFFRKADDETNEAAVVRIFYATDRQPNTAETAGWRWYAAQYRSSLAATGIALLAALASMRWRRRLLRGVAVVAAGGALVLGGMATSTCLRGTGGWLGPEELYGNDRSPEVHLGTCTVSIPRLHRLGNLESPSFLRFELRYDPAKHVMLQSVEPQPSDEFYTTLRGCVTRSERREAFVFIHGYNVSFADAARRTAQLAYDLEFDGAPILYSWPSQGGLLKYTVDESNVDWSIHDLHNFLRDLASQSGARTIHLIAHSMGNRALVGALRSLGNDPSHSSSQFREVILAAPDIDAETFTRDIAPALGRAARRITLYASSHDEALALSKKVHGYPRAGESGDRLVVVPGVETIDVSAVDTSLIGHSYYGDNKSLLADLYAVVNRSLPPGQRDLLRQAQRRGLPYWVFQLRQETDLE